MQYQELQKAPKWVRRKESRPGELLNAALDLFVERGFAATRLEDVAAKAGVSKGTLYLYFKNKEDLFKALLNESISPLISGLEDQIEEAALSPEDAIKTFFWEWWKQFGNTKLAGICKLITAEAGNFPDLALYFQQEIVERNNELLIKLVKNGINAKVFVPQNLEIGAHIWMAPVLMHTIWCNSIGKCAIHQHFSSEQFVELHIEYVLKLLKTP